MKNFSKLMSLVLAAVMVIATLTACGAATKEKTLTMGTNAEFEPFEYRENGEIVGFDVDVANVIAKDSEAKLVIEDMAFDSLITALTGGKIDMIIAGMSVTDERLESVNFSDPYYSATQVIIVPKDGAEVKAKADLEGKDIGVQEGTTGDLYVSDEKNVKDAKIARFKKAIDGALDLKNGKLDAVVLDMQPAKKIVEQNPELTILPEELTKEEYAIAVRKDDKELLDKINASLKKIKEDGTYQNLIKKYIPGDAAALEN